MILVCTVVLASCSLEEEPYSFYSPENFYKNKNDALAALMAAYGSLQRNPIHFFVLSEAPTYEVILRGVDETVFDEYTWESSTENIYRMWDFSYTGINRANVVINRVPQTPNLKPETANLILGEARFLRALFYFNLVRFFGNVPLQVEETTSLDNLYPDNKNTAALVWQQIIEDLSFAEAHLPATRIDVEKGRATRWAATGFLAKVYLQQSGLSAFNPVSEKWGIQGIDEWELVLSKTQEIIQSQQFVLLSNYNEVFDIEFNDERLFEIQFMAGNNEGQNLTQYTTPDGALVGPGYGVSGLTPLFYSEWDTLDYRYKRTLLTAYYSTFNSDFITYPGQLEFPYCGKYRIQDGIGADNGSNITLLRYADVLLMDSEAANEAGTGDPYFGVNLVRARAGLPPLAGLSKEDLRKAIRKERRFELTLEFNGFFDMQRWGTIDTEAAKSGYATDNSHYVYPIPERETNINPNLIQNESY